MWSISRSRLLPLLGPHIFKLSWFLLCTEPISLRAKIKSSRSPIGLHVLCGWFGPLCYRLRHFRYRRGLPLGRNSMAWLKQCGWHISYSLLSLDSQDIRRSMPRPCRTTTHQHNKRSLSRARSGYRRVHRTHHRIFPGTGRHRKRIYGL